MFSFSFTTMMQIRSWLRKSRNRPRLASLALRFPVAFGEGWGWLRMSFREAQHGHPLKATVGQRSVSYRTTARKPADSAVMPNELPRGGSETVAARQLRRVLS